MNSTTLVSLLGPTLQMLSEALNTHTLNAYLIKLFFRVMWISRENFAQYSLPACDIFINYIRQCVTDTTKSDPNFNYMLFECIALAIRFGGQENMPQFDAKLSDVMNLIIQKSIPDLLPYAFQIKALLIRQMNVVSETDNVLLQSVMQPSQWETGSRYYAPTMVAFIEAVLVVNPSVLRTAGNLVMDVCNLLLNIKLDQQAFALASHCVDIFPLEEIDLKKFLQNALGSIHVAKQNQLNLGPRFHRGIIQFVCNILIKHGPDTTNAVMDMVQQDIMGMLIKGEITTNLRSIDNELSRKMVTVALTELLCWSYGKLDAECWVDFVLNLVRMMEQQVNVMSGTVYIGGYIDLPEENTMQMSREGYQKIYSAEAEPVDKLANVQNAKRLFMEKMNGLNIQGGLVNYIAGKMTQDVAHALNTYTSGFNIQV